MIFYVWEYMKFGFFGGFTSRSQQAIGAFQKNPSGTPGTLGPPLRPPFGASNLRPASAPALGPVGEPTGFSKIPPGFRGI